MSSKSTIYGSIGVSIAFVMELTLVPLFLPVIQAEFGLSIMELAWFFNSYGISVAIGVLLGGWLGDKFNLKNIFALGVLFFAAGSALVAWADSYELMIFARAMQGFGGGVFSPLVPILLTRASPDRPGKVLILWGSVSGYAAALAPLLYSSFVAGMGWNFAFTIFAVVSVAALVVVQKSKLPVDDPSHPTSSLNRAMVFRSRELWLMFGYIFCTYGSISFYLFFIPIRLAEQGITVVSIGLILSLMWMTFSVASTLLRNSVDEPMVRRILTVAPILIAAGFCAAYYANSMVVWAVSAALVGGGLACSNAPSTLLVLKFAPKGTSALSASLDISFARIGGVITIFAFTHAFYGAAVAGICLLSVAAGVLAFQATKALYPKKAPDAVGS